MGYAPADDPQIAIYVVVDRPNVQYQDDAKFATRIVRGILTEVLPYMGIFMTEELSDKEKEELEALQIEIRTAPVTEEEAEEGDGTTEEGTGEENGEGAAEGEETEKEEVWKSFPIDPATGYAVDPNTGDMVDPVTGAVIGGSYDEKAEEPEASPIPESSADPQGDVGQ